MAVNRNRGGGGSWMDKPTAGNNVKFNCGRPGGMSDDSDFSDSDDDYNYEKRSRRNRFNWQREEPKLTPEEQLQNAFNDRNPDLSAIKKVIAENQIKINDPIFRTGGWTLLILACKNMALEVVEYLITEGADVSYKAKDWYTPLLALATSTSDGSKDDSDLEKIAQLLLSKLDSVDCIETHGLSPLMFAVKNKRVNLVRLLLDKGADVNLPDNTGMTSLHFAAQVGSGQIVRLLLEKGADATLKDESDATPLQIARCSDNINCLKVFKILDWVEATKWRPGLHPDLMDEENPNKTGYWSTDVQQYCQDQAQQIELYLIVHDMEKYIPLFKEQMIHYNQFFWMDHKQLLEVGIEDEADRNKIIEDHNKSRKKDQMCPPFMRDGYTSFETLCMLTNIGDHVEYQTDLLEGFYRLVRDKPELLNSGIETYTPTDIIEGSKEVTETTYKLDKAVAELYAALTDFEKDSKRKAALLNNNKNSISKPIIFGIAAVGISVGICIFLRLRS